MPGGQGTLEPAWVGAQRDGGFASSPRPLRETPNGNAPGISVRFGACLLCACGSVLRALLQPRQPPV